MRTVAFRRLSVKKTSDGADDDEKFVTYEVGRLCTSVQLLNTAYP
jgi:hypothetical protein